MTFGALAGGLLRADSDHPDAAQIRHFNKSASHRGECDKPDFARMRYE